MGSKTSGKSREANEITSKHSGAMTSVLVVRSMTEERKHKVAEIIVSSALREDHVRAVSLREKGVEERWRWW